MQSEFIEAINRGVQFKLVDALDNVYWGKLALVARSIEVADDELREVIQEAYDYHQALIDESDRGAAILAAAQFEEWLRERITSRFVKISKTLDKKLFDGFGPLSTFAAKIDIAYALELYGEDIRKGLHTIKHNRNKFAHTSKPLYFSDNAISELCCKLSPQATSDCQDLRKIYMNYLTKAQNDTRSSLLSRRLTRHPPVAARPS